jgi:hypothetical protein
MNIDIHVEKPDGEVLKTDTAENKKKQPTDTNDANDNAAGPKKNPDPRANANLSEKDKQGQDSGTGTEITDGEAG